eukprot:scaffold22713_cov139-Cylindrotheca_fusiformis.AAC.2
MTMSIKTALFLFGSLLFQISEAYSCEYINDAPIIEAPVPSLQHKLKFLNVDATVYRHTLSEGELPRLRFLQYSSTPIIDSTGNEVVISADGHTCNQKSEGFLSKATSSSFLVTGLLAATASNQFRSLGMVAMMSMGLLAFKTDPVEAVDDCTPSMQVVLEAPPYYLGSVDECLDEVENKNHCPEPFPEFEACSDPTPSCKLAVVGAGTGGLYTAMRLVDEGKYSGEDICIFEATERVGGRLYSLRGFGPENDISVDAGGYRTWPEYTPTLHTLITEYLGLPMDCYDDSEPCEVYNIVSDTGEKAGFATFVEEMMQRLIDDGACFFPRHELKSMQYDEDDGMKTLKFSNGVTGTAETLILNVPQRPLLTILRKSDLPLEDDFATEMFDSLHSVQTEIVNKLYLYYNNSWWYDLGLKSGEFEMSGDARNMPLGGRYHDGHVKCNDEGCYGFLLAVYIHDYAGDQAQFFRRYQRDRPEPVTIISNHDAESRAFLKHAHDRIANYHLYENENKTYTGFEAEKIFQDADPPEFAVLSTWNIGLTCCHRLQTFGAGGGWHHWTDLDNYELAMKPLNQFGIHVINEAFSKLQGWAEGSLMLADEVLQEFFDVDRPWDFEEQRIVQFVEQTNVYSPECEDADGGGSVGGGGTGGGGGNTDDGVIDLCFTKDALVAMADGSMKTIDKIVLGDLVSTGFSGEVGEVTEVLVHKVETSGETDIAVISTEHGDLVGTPSHPIYMDGQWVEMQDAIELGLLERHGFQAKTTSDVVDFFYNLEIDGKKPGDSTHSYVVNGIVASGLGDNEVLNTMFPRQTLWKVKA